MYENRTVRNELSGHVDGSTIQAGTISGNVIHSSPRTIVNTIVQEARSLRILATLYRALASLMALVPLAVGGSPLDGVAVACKQLGIPSAWVAATSSWISARDGILSRVACLLLVLGLLALPKRRDIGGDLGEVLEWRAPSTAVLSFALMVQCDRTGEALFAVACVAALGAWVVTWGEYRFARSEHIMVAVGSVFLAVVFIPLVLLSWLYGRDSGGGVSSVSE